MFEDLVKRSAKGIIELKKIQKRFAEQNDIKEGNSSIRKTGAANIIRNDVRNTLTRTQITYQTVLYKDRKNIIKENEDVSVEKIPDILNRIVAGVFNF